MAKIVTENSFGFLVTDIVRLLRKEFDRRVRGTGMTRSQWQVIAHLLRSEGINQSQLADRMEVVPITLVRLIDRLEAAGLVERRPDPNDRRAYQLYLTTAARSHIETFEEISAELRQETLAGLSLAERNLLVDLLLKVKGNLSNKTPEALLEAAVHE